MFQIDDVCLFDKKNICFFLLIADVSCKCKRDSLVGFLNCSTCCRGISISKSLNVKGKCDYFCLDIYIYIYIYIYISGHVYIQIDKQIDRQIDRYVSGIYIYHVYISQEEFCKMEHWNTFTFGSLIQKSMRCKQHKDNYIKSLEEEGSITPSG